MGMYDYLNGNQVKCFPIGVIYGYNEKCEIEFSTIGGLLRSINTGDEVPYRSAIYNYGKDFLILDFMGNSLDEFLDKEIYSLYIVENGILKDEITIDLDDKEILSKLSVIENIGNRTVIGIRGENFKIENTQDILGLIIDYKEAITKYFEEIKEIQPLFHEYIEKLREDINDESLKLEYDSKLSQLRSETLEKFHKRWVKDESLFSNNIGFFIENLRIINYFGDDNTELLLLSYKNQDLEKYEKEVSEYKEWVEGYLTSEDVDNLLDIEDKRGNINDSPNW